MDSSKHTPTPWVAQGRYIGTPNHMSYIGECSDQNGNWSNAPMSSANAAFIVHAVNSHDQLVAALQACLGTLEHVNVKEGYCCCGDDMEAHGNPMDCGHSPVDAGTYSAGLVMEAARAALAAASA